MAETTTWSGVEQQSAFAAPVPGEQHRWLEKLLGEWRYESPQGKSEVLVGSETFSSIGEIWVQGVGHGPMPDGQSATTVMTLGYDPAKGRFVGTWVGSMMHHLWIYEGRLDEDGRRLVLDSEGPDFEAPGRTRRYRDIITFEADDVRTLTGEIQGDDGSWSTMIAVRYTKV